MKNISIIVVLILSLITILTTSSSTPSSSTTTSSIKTDLENSIKSIKASILSISWIFKNRKQTYLIPIESYNISSNEFPLSEDLYNKSYGTYNNQISDYEIEYSNDISLIMLYIKYFLQMGADRGCSFEYSVNVAFNPNIDKEQTNLLKEYKERLKIKKISKK